VTLSLSAASVDINTAVTITAAASSEYSLSNFTVTVNGEALVLADGEAEFTPTAAGLYEVNAAAYDIHGGKTAAAKQFAAFDPSKTGSVSASITDLNTQNITAPTTITGSVSNAKIAYYTLSYAAASITKFDSSGNPQDMAEPAAGDYTVFASGPSGTSTSLGTFDPTLLENGYYRIKLSVYGKSGSAEYTTLVQVTGKMKIGNFTSSSNDINIPVFNFPLTVTREYDSRNKGKSGDFGYGWDLSLSRAKLSENGTPGLNWKTVPAQTIFGIVLTYKTAEAEPHNILIDWGNGKAEHFNYVVGGTPYQSPDAQYDVTISYASAENTGNTLVALGSSNDMIYSSGKLYTFNGYNAFNPSKYKLTRPDGSSFTFNDTTGVESVKLPDGESVTITSGSITHSKGESISVTRDSSGRVTQINSSDGRSVSYAYDGNGDLTEFTDPAGEATHFYYDNEHYLTDIVDPRGIRTAKNIYDDSGRLISIIDPNGNEIEYTHNIADRQDVVTDRMGNSTVYYYDNKGNITETVDELGNSTTFTYDTNNFKSSETDALGNTKHYSYNAYGDLLSVTDGLGGVVTNTYDTKHRLTTVSALDQPQLVNIYDSYGRITKITDAMGYEETYAYNSDGLVTSIADSIGTATQMTYGSDGKIVSSTNGAGEAVAYTWDTYGRAASKTVMKDGTGVTENYVYDVLGNLTQIAYADGSILNMEYDPAGFLTAEVDTLGRRTEFDRDPFGNITQIEYPDSTVETFTYDNEGRNTSATNRRGMTILLGYDATDNLISKTYPNGAQVAYSYDAAGNLISVTEADGAVTSYGYDALGNNTSVTDPLENVFAYTYGANGLMESFADALGNTTQYTYDANGNRTETAFEDGTSVSAAYDARGRLVSETDQNGNTTAYGYDEADRLTSVTDAADGEWLYSYDGTGNLTGVTDPEGGVASYAYDDCGHLTQVTDQAGQSAYSVYDTEGNLTEYTDFGGDTTEYGYDSDGRVATVTTGSDVRAFSYTDDGLLAEISGSEGVNSYTYDVVDGLASAQKPDGSQLVYNYGLSGKLAGVALNKGGNHYETVYGYDLNGRLTSVIGYDGAGAEYEYDANGNRTAAIYSNGGSIEYGYDELNRLVEETVYDGASVLAHYSYTLDSAGNRTGITETGGAEERVTGYVYDSLGRLTSETLSVGDSAPVATSYEYDSVSNRVSKTAGGIETTYTYNAAGRLLSETDGVTTTSYTYDGNGNLIEKADGEDETDYAWDAFGRLRSVTAQSGQDVSVEAYGYDYSGNRVSKTTEEGTTYYIIDENAALPYVLAEANDDGYVSAWYTAADEIVALSRVDEVRHYYFDGHGDTRILADETGAVTDTYDYDAYGNLVSSTGTTVNEFLYGGQQYDEGTGLYYLRARYMSPQTGTFISRDPFSGSIADPASLHKYLYANANPVTYTDPTGMYSLAEINTTFALQNILMRSYMDGLFNFLMAYARGETDPGTLLNEFFNGFAGGLLFGGLPIGSLAGIFKIGCKGQMLFNAGLQTFALAQNLGVAYQDFKNGDTEAAAIGVARSGFDLLSGLRNLGNTRDNCFDGDTEVATEDGQRRIDEIETGDRVWAYDTESGILALKEVTKVYEKQSDGLVHIATAEGNIDATSTHPFYTPKKGWVAAIDLRAGDILVTVNGNYAVVEQVQHELLEAPVTVYNLEVEGYHTYFVGDADVLVHNVCKLGRNLEKDKIKKPDDGKDYHAHHYYPQKFRKDFFEEVKIDIDEATRGEWVERTSHLSNAWSYNNVWEEQIIEWKKGVKLPNKTTVEEFFANMGRKY
jgi:RHS repeat-associated protein